MFGDTGIKFASIIAGIIFIIALIIVANRFGGQIRQKLSTRLESFKTTPSPQPETSVSPQPETFGEIVGGQTKGEMVYTLPDAKQTPDTGAEVLVIPALISLFGIGFKLRKIS